MKPKSYELLCKCIEDGINSGWTHSHKHTETPDPIAIKEMIFTYITNEISDWFSFDDENP